MSLPILATKLYIPPPRSQIVHRSHLIDELNESLHHKLTLISAPAGFGKTTLLSEWIANYGQPAGWLSLDEGDKDPARFLIYLVAALQTVVPNIGEGVLAALQSPQQPPTESILISLLNEIAAFPDDFIIILDDYHAVDSKQVDNALAFLLEHQPPQLHLVIATREDPQLPLARYRARGQLIELRHADLRFSPTEAAEFLNQAMGLNLSAEDIVALETRTEGWIAGLQLAGISMKGYQDTSSFIQSFTGSHRFVMDYLVEEVLRQQPENVQNFLLHTSILDRLCSSLCDAVLPGPSACGQETLEYLEHANLFIAPLDNARIWYRYHQLFAELLRTRLEHTYPDRIAELHRRASDWFAQNDLPNEAITHALAIHDWPRAAEVIERFSDQLPMHADSKTRLGWFESLPTQILMERPELGLTYAWALFLSNQLEQAEQQLNQLIPLVQTTPSLLGEYYVIRVMIATRRYDMTDFFELAKQALQRVPPEEASPRSRILLTLGVAHDEMRGDIASAKKAFGEAYELSKASPSPSSVGNAPLPLIALAYLADYELLEGNLRNASRMYEEAIELSTKWGGQSSIALCLVQQGRASLLYEWNDLDGTEHALQECFRIGELWRNPRLLVPAYGLSALVRQRRGRADEANDLIQRAEQAMRDSYASPYDMGMLALYQIALRTAQGDLPFIELWEQDHDSEWRSRTGRARDALTIVLARAQIERFHRSRDGSALGQARALIEPALEQAQARGLMLYVVRLLSLNGLALYARGETSSAVTNLKRALMLAEPENYMRSMLDLGKPMEEILRWALESQSLSEPHLVAYVTRLLSQFSIGERIETSQPTSEALIEPLAERELEILRLIALGLSNREISERLFLAMSTVKGYNRIIFDKLQVQRRTEAVARARQLGLL